jgi:hypothetical protein
MLGQDKKQYEMFYMDECEENKSHVRRRGSIQYLF